VLRAVEKQENRGRLGPYYKQVTPPEFVMLSASRTCAGLEEEKEDEEEDENEKNKRTKSCAVQARHPDYPVT
jgi:hypothetical protein